MRKVRLAIALLVLGHAFACSSDPGGTDGNPGGSNNGTPGNGTPGNGTPGNGTPGNGTPTLDEDAIIPANSVWRQTSEWYRAIDDAPVAEHSSEMIGALAKWGQTGIFQIDFSFNVLNGQGAPDVSFPPE